MREPDLDPLYSSYVPNTLLFRDEHLATLVGGAVLSTPINFYCEGATGTGKTLVIWKFIRTLNKNEHLIIHVPYSGAITREFRFSIEQTMGKKTYRVNPFDVVMQTKQPFIHIIFDGICIDKFLRNFFVKLGRRIYIADKKVQVIVLSTKPYGKFLLCLPEDIRHIFKFKHVFFEEYDAEQIKKILSQRLNLCNIEYDDEAMRWLGNKLCKKRGSIWYGLRLLANARATIKNRSTTIITQPIIKNVWHKYQLSFKKAKKEKLSRE